MLATPLVALNGTSGVTFRDIAFEFTRGDAIRVTSGTNNLIAGCVLRNIGNMAVRIEG